MEEVIVRQYRQDDRSFIREIAWDTAFMGQPASAFFDSKDILVDFLTRYFTDYSQESCFVAESKGKVIGYLIGTKNEGCLKKIFMVKIFWGLLFRAIFSTALFRKKNLAFFLRCVVSFLKGEFNGADFSCDYPAVLHINLRDGFRNQGIGSRLIAIYLNYLNREEIPGVHLATMSDKAKDFFQKRGFNLLYTGRRSYFNYILHNDIPIYILGRRLP
jgi:GNAT superfamily N-acetyltransferase